MIFLQRFSKTFWVTTLLAAVATLAMFPTSLASAAGAREDGGAFDRPRERDRIQVTLVTGIVWEGATLRRFDLDALQQLREKFPHQAFTHFVNPAYFVRDKNAHQHAAAIGGTMRPGDGVAMHVAPWKSIVSRAGVLFRDGPTFWGHSLSALECSSDCGREIPLSIYPAEDIRKIAATSAATLEMHGFGRPRAVQVSGWMASPSVMEQLAAIGLQMDFSSVAPSSVKPYLGRFPLFTWINDLWSDELAAQGMHMVMTPNGAITTHPSNGGIVDQRTVAEITAAFERLISGSASAPGANRFFYLGMHQETAARYSERFILALESIRSVANSRHVNLTTLVPPGGAIPAAAVNVSH